VTAVTITHNRVRPASFEHWPVVAILLGALVVWELVGDLNLLGQQTVPSLHAVISQLWQDRSLYPANLAATGKEAVLGFLIGNAIAISLAYLFVLFAPAERALMGLMIALYSMPAIAALPVLAAAFSANTAKVTLAAMMVMFPTLINTLLGLRSVDRAMIDVIDVFGGNRLTVMRRARARAALPSLILGLQISAPAALLGAVLAEFVGGTKGLGVFMLNSLAEFNAARTWGAGLVATVVASAAFFVFMFIGRRIARSNASPVIGLGPAMRAVGGSRWRRIVTISAQTVLGVVVVIGAWYLFVDGLGLNPLFAKTPSDVWSIITGPSAGRIWHAFGQTVPVTIAGLAGGLLAASAGAIVFVLLPSFERATLPLALVLQSVPLAASAPVLIIIFGRGVAVTIIIATIVTFFPSLVTVVEGLRRVPPASVDVLDVYGASRWTTMWRVRIPYAVPAFLAAARLVAPLALLGVMIAEWLATGTGLGGDMQNARFLVEFGIVWAEAAVATAFAVAAYLLIGVAEAIANRRFGTGPA
jgi:sulfonate transport system permease protein